MFACQDVTQLQIVYPDTALRLQALLDFEEVGGEKRVAGDEWLFEGPGTFMFKYHTKYSLQLKLSARLRLACLFVQFGVVQFDLKPRFHVSL